MTHDKNGQPLKVGDKVTIECTILSICEGEYCTTDVETVGNGQKNRIGALNAKQLVKVAMILLAMFLFARSASAEVVAWSDATPKEDVCDCVLTGECTCGNVCTCGLTVTDVQLAHEGHDCPNCGYKSVLDKHRTLSGGRHSHKCPQCGMEWAHADQPKAASPVASPSPWTAKPATPPLPSTATAGSKWTLQGGQWVPFGAPPVALPPAPRVIPSPSAAPAGHYEMRRVCHGTHCAMERVWVPGR